tara:strand:+ start:593 stop:898 length:306 start_codon:yes stop_codon:yes gene_type:complete
VGLEFLGQSLDKVFVLDLVVRNRRQCLRDYEQVDEASDFLEGSVCSVIEDHRGFQKAQWTPAHSADLEWSLALVGLAASVDPSDCVAASVASLHPDQFQEA